MAGLRRNIQPSDHIDLIAASEAASKAVDACRDAVSDYLALSRAGVAGLEDDIDCPNCGQRTQCEGNDETLRA